MMGDGAAVPQLPLLHRGAWEGSQLPAPLSPASSLPEKGFSAAEPCQLGDFGNCPCFSLPHHSLSPGFAPGACGRGAPGWWVSVSWRWRGLELGAHRLR